MRTQKPRVVPIDKSDWTNEQTEVMASMTARKPMYERLNIFRVLIRHPVALRALQDWLWHIHGSSNTLGLRERELAVLRTGYLCQSGYEWAQHVRIAREMGFSSAEIDAVKIGATADNWSSEDAAILTACDELHSDQFVSDDTWALLSRFLGEQQRMDLVFTVGQYTLVSMFLNSFGVQLDDFLTLDPDLVGQRLKASP
jgi:4-carboxymuconolactone decarboxylase